MGILTDILIADISEGRAIGEAEAPWEQWPYLHAHGCDQINLSSLLCVLNGQEWQDEVLDEFTTLYQKSDEGPWVTLLPGQLISQVAALSDDEVRTIISLWVRSEDMAGTSVPLLQNFLKGLRELAQQALTSNKSLLVWQCL